MLIQKIYKNLSKIAIVFLFLISLSFTSLVTVVGADISIPVYVGPNGTDGQGGAICNFDSGNNFCKKGKTGESYKAYKDCSQSALPDSDVNGIVTAGLPIAACSPSFKTYATEPSFALIKTDADAITNGTGTGGTPATGNLTYSTKKYKVNLKGKTETVDLQCDFASKACGIQTAALKVTYAGCTEKPPDSAECTSKVSDTFIQTKAELATASTAANVDISGAARTGAASGASNALGSLFTILFNIVLAVLSLLAWFFGTALSYIMFLLGGALLVLIRVNPAAGEWIQVASAPWGVVQSIANLVILGTFIFVAFAYILNITKYKTKIDSFLTNIVIVAIVTNLTLLGCASIINIAQGVGDAFIGGYASIKKIKDPGDYNGIAQVFIGDTLTSFKKVSAIRCNNVVGSTAGTGVSGQTPAKTGATQTVAQAKTAAECGDFEGASNLGNTFGDVFKKDTGTNASTLIRELVYIGIVGFGILAFWRIMMLALIRAVSLWLLMVTSPLALVAYFSPEGFGLKKQADKWAHNFFHFTIFYPAFVLGLILAQEMTGAFNTATTAAATTIKSANVASGVVSSDSTQIIILTLLGGLVAVGILKLLADFFEGALKEITEAAWNGAKALATVGATGLRVAAPALNLPGKGALAVLNKGLNFSQARSKEKIGRLSVERNSFAVGTKEYNRADRKLKSETNRLKGIKRRQRFYQKNLPDLANKLANFTEMLPERVQELEKIPGSVGDKWALQKKARIASFRAGDKSRTELWLRQNEWAQGVFGNPDLDPDAVYRGLSADIIKKNSSTDPDWARKQVENAVSGAYSKTLGTDKAIAKQYAVARMKGILDKANGDYSSLKGVDKDIFNDIINQNYGDTAIMSQLAADTTLKNGVRQALSSGNLNSDAITGLRTNSPIFIGGSDDDDVDRKAAIAGMGAQQFDNLPSYNLYDNAVESAARANPAIDFANIDKKLPNRGFKSVYEANAIDKLKSDEGVEKSEIARHLNTSSFRLNAGVSTSTEMIASLGAKFRDSADVTDAEKIAIFEKAEEREFGNDETVNAILTKQDLNGVNYSSMSDEDRAKALKKVSNVARTYHNEFSNSVAPEQLITEMGREIGIAKDSYKESRDSYRVRIEELAKDAAKTLSARDASVAAHNQESATIQGLSSKSGDEIRAALINYNGTATAPNSDYETLRDELGINGAMAGFSKQVNKSLGQDVATGAHMVSVGTNQYDLRDVASDGKSKELASHLASITVAFKTGTSAQLDDAKAKAISAFGNYDEVEKLINDNFSAAKGYTGFDNSINTEGEKQIEDLRSQVENALTNNRQTQNSATSAEYKAKAADILKKRLQSAKDAAAKAQESVSSNAEKINKKDLERIFDLQEAPKINTNLK
jgi:hypothetical protein